MQVSSLDGSVMVVTEARAPRGLRAPGRALWVAVVGVYDLEPHELVVLGQAAKTADRIAALDMLVDRDGVLVDGQPHPALKESRFQRGTLARLVASLRLPDREGDRPQRRGAYRRSYKPRLVGHGA